ncbi:MAG: hypothetical protein AAF479_05440, partial [Pseudomonadota bacterium]
RQAQPVKIAQRSDASLSCSQIDTETSINNGRIASLIAEEDDKRAQNIMAAAGAVLFFAPLLFAMDFQDAAGTEREALEQRQFHLAELSTRRCKGKQQIATANVSTTDKEIQQLTTSLSAPSSDASEVAAAMRAALEHPPVPGSPPLFEGTEYTAFTPEQLQAYCQQSWQMRISASGRTEYNPCTQRSAFR